MSLPDNNNCCGCQACKSICPKNAITMSQSLDGFYYPVINTDLCVRCNKCERVCPVKNKSIDAHNLNYAIAAYSKDNYIRGQSSSGGVFSHLAKEILVRHGVVVGASFSADYRSVCHTVISNTKELSLLRGSKYLQSDIGNTFSIVKKNLDMNRFVLFSGTGCQIAGLKNYLGKEYEKLYLIDVVCHGVPSKSIWDSYLDKLEKKFCGKVNYVNFRNKQFHRRKYTNRRKGIYYRSVFDDGYLKLFQKNYILRESCFSCKYKSIKGISDISIGDLWGADKIVGDFADDKGVSFVLVHSEKGMGLLRSIQKHLELKDINLDLSIENNRNISFPSTKPESLSAFKLDYYRLPFDAVMKKYTTDPLLLKIKNILKKKLKLLLFKRDNKSLMYGLLVRFKKER